MGKSLIIKGADFSNVAVEQVEFIDVIIEPSWVNGKIVRPSGLIDTSENHKYALIEIPSSATKIQSRIAVSIASDKDLIFMSGSSIVSTYPTSQSPSTELGNLFVADIPEGATSVYVNYMSDSRATELGYPVLNTISFV